MLTHLSIADIVLIDRAELAFGPGLCVLTGETGAGKSILLDALGLALGGRGDPRLIRKGRDKASVTAEFSLRDGGALTALLEELGIEAGETLVLRRQLSADGKSRAFVNDQAVSAGALKSIGEKLVEVYGQHQQRGLLDPVEHGRLLDAYGRLEAEAGRVREAHRAWKEQGRALAELREAAARTAREKDYLDHMRAELKALNPSPGEEDALATKRATMMQAEKLAGVLDEALAELTQPRAVMQALRSAQNILMRSVLKDNERLAPIVEALERAMTETDEARSAIETLGENSGFDAAELEAAEERLFALRAAARKYGVALDDLPELRGQVEEKLALLREQETRAAALARAVEEAKTAYRAEAEGLSGKRARAAKRLESALRAEMEPLKMAATRFRAALEPLEEKDWSERGMDRIRFEAATNKGADFGPLDAIASGGELSRFMLALAVVLKASRTENAATIFDEIDAGTGGAVADAIGRRLEELGKRGQVIVVTHLPQVAARGGSHFLIEKEEKGAHALTRVRLLSPSEKKEEIARMMSGARVTDAARKAAEHLLEAV